MKKVRSSSAPLLMICPQSDRGELDIDVDNDMGRMGDACHEAMAEWVRSTTMPDIERLCQVHRIEGSEKELAMLCGYGRAAWAELSDKFPAPVVEQALEAKLSDELILTGHSDLYSLQSDHVRVLDWKSGRVRTNFYHQMASYGVLTTRSLGVTSAKVTTVWLRYGEHETHNVQPHQLDRTIDDLHSAIKSETYSTGDHCCNCKRFGECKAQRQLVHGALGMVGELGEGYSPRDNAGKLHIAFGGLKSAQRAYERLRVSIRSDIERNNDEPILVQGGEFSLIPKCRKKLVDPRIWGPIATEYITQDQLADCMGKGLTALKTAVGANAERGQKGKRIAELIEKLESAGCIDENHYTELSLS